MFNFILDKKRIKENESTKHIDKKIELVSCYNSYFSDTLLHNIKGLAAYRGQMTDSKYAEAFEMKWRTI